MTLSRNCGTHSCGPLQSGKILIQSIDGSILQVHYIGVSNETSYGVMRFAQLAEQLGLPKIVSIQNSYSLLVCICFCGRSACALIKARHGAPQCSSYTV